MGRREIGSGIIALVALVAAYLLPVTFPTLSGPQLALAWIAVAVAFLVGLYLVWRKPKAPAEPERKWKSLCDLFDTDFPHLLKYSRDIDWASRDGTAGKARVSLIMDFDAHVDFLSIYFPREAGVGVIRDVAAEIAAIREGFRNQFECTSSFVGASPSVSSREIDFSKRVFVYHEAPLEPRQVADLIDAFAARGLRLQLRGHSYAMTKNLGDAASHHPS